MENIRELWTKTRTAVIAAGLMVFGAGVTAQQNPMYTSSPDAQPGNELMETLEEEHLTVFASIVEAARLEDDLEAESPLTLLVPNNGAYARISDDVIEGHKQNREAVFHLAFNGTLTSFDLLDREESLDSLRPLSHTGGVDVVLNEEGQAIAKDSDQEARIIDGPIWADDDVIYVIDTVLLPEEDAYHKEPVSR